MTPLEWRAQGEWLTWRGLRLFVRQQGRGQPVLVLHAFPTASYDFWKIVGLLQAHYRFILFDFPGFGFSDKPTTFPYSLHAYADAAQAVCHYFGLTELWILAHDIGDSVALELLRRDLLRGGMLHIERLCLLNGSVWSIPFTDWRMALSQRVSLHPLMGALISHGRLFRKAALRNFFRAIFARPLTAAEVDAFWSLIAYNEGAANYHRLMRYMPERWQHQLTWLDALATHPAPLTLIWGMADPVATPAVAEVVQQYRPEATAIRLANVGHYPHWEVPDVVVEALLTAWDNTSST